MSGLDDYIAQQQKDHPIEETPAEGTPAEGTTPAEGAPAEGTPAEGTPAEGTPAEGTPAEGAPAEGTPAEGTPTEGVVELDDNNLNTFFDTTGKTKDDIKSTYALGVKYSEIESERDEVSQQLETIRAENAELKKGLDPLSHFSSEQAYVAEQLRKKYPTMDPVAIQKATGSDLTKMEDLDVLALQDTIKRPGAKGGEAMARKIIADQYGIDLSEPRESWDEMAIAKLERAAIDARHELSTFQNEVELPTIKSEEDLQTERATQLEELKGQWAPALPELTNFTKITLPGLEEGTSFEFEVPEEFRSGLGEFFEAMITEGELEPDSETVKALMIQREKDFIYQNLNEILAARDANLRTSVTKQTDDKLGNNTPPNTSTAPAVGEKLSGTEQHLANQKGRIRK